MLTQKEQKDLKWVCGWEKLKHSMNEMFQVPFTKLKISHNKGILNLDVNILLRWSERWPAELVPHTKIFVPCSTVKGKKQRKDPKEKGQSLENLKFCITRRL